MAVQTTEEGMVPLLINCWPSASGGESYVNIEYESTTDFDLQNVAIAIPLPALASSPKVNQVRFASAVCLHCCALCACHCRAQSGDKTALCHVQHIIMAIMRSMAQCQGIVCPPAAVQSPGYAYSTVHA